MFCTWLCMSVSHEETSCGQSAFYSMGICVRTDLTWHIWANLNKTVSIGSPAPSGGKLLEFPCILIWRLRDRN